MREPEMAGLAQGVKTSSALGRVGVYADAFIWRWRPGMKGEAYPPHAALNGRVESGVDGFDALPQADLNGEYCQCYIQTRWRDTRGRFAPGGLI